MVPSIANSEENDEVDAETYTMSEESGHEKRKGGIQEAEKSFVRYGGIVYVPNDSWVKYQRQPTNCHLYISLTSMTESRLNGAKGIKFSSRPSSIAPYQPASQIARNESGGEYVNYELPNRVRIVNQLLHDEISKIIGIGDCNHDHVAPFRSLVPFEQEFRALHEAKEKEFEKLASMHPSHPAIHRNTPWIPEMFAYYVEPSEDGENYNFENEVELAKILLDGLRALIYFLDNELAELIAITRKIRSRSIEKIPFAYLWYLFEPGQEIISLKPNCQVYRVLQVTGGRKSVTGRKGRWANSGSSFRKTVSDLVVDCFYLDFDGKRFKPVPKSFRIPPYEDSLPITSLEIHPFIYQQERLEEFLNNRGQKFVELVQVTHRKFSGLSLKEGDLYDRYDEIDSEVMIDFELAFRNSQPLIPTPDFGGGVILKPTEEDEEETRERGIYYDDERLMNSRWSQFMHRTKLLEPQSKEGLGRDSRVLLTYRVYGYVLLNRKWYPLDIEKVEPIKDGEEDGFESLILPPGHRDIVRALVQTHANPRTTSNSKGPGTLSHRQFDIVKGKGKGLIILLHGAPGVGKTSTAECVAAHTRRPLFPITCGDLGGHTAQEVEQNLEKYFDLARKWGCVLLLDEADVFLSERMRGNIMQNSLVSVFLRVLEYYSGILILTTNRVGEFDEAVKSRVHCTLYFPPLDKYETVKIWEKSLERLTKQNQSPGCELSIRFDHNKIIRFAESHWDNGHRWNGRQIKNAFQTAVALAEADRNNIGAEANSVPELKRKHFQVVASASAHFDRYLTQVRQTDTSRARREELRRDDIRSLEAEVSTRREISSRSKKMVVGNKWSERAASEASDEYRDTTTSRGYLKSNQLSRHDDRGSIEANVDQRSRDKHMHGRSPTRRKDRLSPSPHYDSFSD